MKLTGGDMLRAVIKAMLPGFADQFGTIPEKHMIRGKHGAYVATRHVKPEEAAAAKPEPRELSPEEDYKQNGTKAKAFKAWFGDWENDPANASKVVDAKTGDPLYAEWIGYSETEEQAEARQMAMLRHGAE